MKQLIRNILREETIKKFNKINVNRGKLSSSLEKIATDYLGKEKICDVVAIKIDDLYTLMILYNGPSRYNLTDDLTKHINNIIPVKLFVLINDTKC